MKEVLSEMRPGGAYENLRKEFNATLARDENFSAAYENAAGALDAFADQREKAAPILQNGNAGLLARLEALDQQIVKASAEVPGKEAGKSNLDEALQNGREALTQAFETIRNVFSRHSPSASPGMSP
jgi:ABC-type transporter Mla subunit MlaD